MIMKRLVFLTTLAKQPQFFIPSLLFVLAFGCKSKETVDSSDVNEAQIYRILYVDYNDATQYLTTRIEFRVGGETGTSVKLVEPSAITMNDQPMVPYDTDISGTYYKVEFKTDTPDQQFTFQWKLKSGELVSQGVTLFDAASILEPSADSSLSRDNVLTVKFTPAVTGFRETMSARVLDRCPYEIGRKVASGICEEGNLAYVQPAELADLGTGSGCIQLTHYDKDAFDATEQHKGGEIHMTRISAYHPISIADQ